MMHAQLAVCLALRGFCRCTVPRSVELFYRLF